MNIIIAAALLASQPAETVQQAAATAQPAAQTDSRTLLWRDIRAGMTRAEVRAIHPAQADVVHHREEATIIENYEVTDKCKATVRIYHEQGNVDRVVVRGEGSIGGRCSDTVLTGLSSRYGEALNKERSGDGLFRRVNTAYVWNRDGVTLRFRKFNGGAFGGNGLGAPSWELTYSEIEDQIAL
jgi:hypothetical protein